MTAPLHEEEALGKPYDAALMRACCATSGLRLDDPGRHRHAARLGAAPAGGAVPHQVAIDRAIPAKDLHSSGARPGDGCRVLAEFALEYGQTVLTAFIGQRVMVDCGSRSSSSCSAAHPFYDRNPVAG